MFECDKKTYARVLVTGATGFMGRHILPALKEAMPRSDIIGVGSRDFNLLDRRQAEKMLAATRPDAVVHLAAKVGGIIANRNYPADFLYENLSINTHTFHACFKAGVSKFLSLIGGCSYPATASSPIGEEQMWMGYPQPESAPYSLAKRMLLVQSETYRRQYGFNSVILVPGNVYGEHDNFNEEYAHVIPAMIRRFVEAAERGLPSVKCHGTGRAARDFVYAGDVARLIPLFLAGYDSSTPVNISSGSRTTIAELASLIRSAAGYAGGIEWDSTKPDGQIEKIFAVSRLKAMGMSCDTPLETGIRRTVEWFRTAKAGGTARL